MVNSINTNIAAYFAQANIGVATDAATASVSRLSSGNRIVKASDDVAGLSIGTALRTGVSALRTALTNASQGTSLLQVADGALSQVTEILQRQRAIAFQAGSGTLTDGDRVFLNQEFQALTQEIDRLTGSTNFNGVNLLNGALSTAAGIGTNTAASDAGTLRITFDDVIAAGETLQVNGVNLVGLASAGTDPRTFVVTGDVATTLQNLADTLNNLASNSTYGAAIGEATYSVEGNTLVVNSRTGGAISNNFVTSSAATTYSLDNATIAADAQGTNATYTVTLANAGFNSDQLGGYVVGQTVYLSGQTTQVSGERFNDTTAYTITAVTSTGFTIQTAYDTTGDGVVAVGGDASSTVQAASAAFTSTGGISEASFNGGFGGASFGLFSTSAATSASTVLVAATAAAATPFQTGESLTAIVNGVTNTLYTFATGDTISDIVDGINANTANSGFKAALVYSGGAYNIRLSSQTDANNIIVDYGASYVGTNYALGGQGIDPAIGNSVEANTTAQRSVFATSYVDLFTADGLTVANTTTDVTNASGTTDAAPFVAGDTISLAINGESQTLYTIASGDDLDAIIAGINANSDDTGVYAVIAGTGGAYNIRLYASDSGGTPAVAGQTNDIITLSSTGGTSFGAGLVLSTSAAGTADKFGVIDATTDLVKNSNFGLFGGADTGISAGSVSVTGSVGNSILTSLSQTKANSSLIFTANATALDTITIGSKVFTFTENTTRGVDEVLIGSSISETIDNLINTIQSYLDDGNATGEEAFVLSQLDFTRSGNTFNITGKGLGNITDLDGSAVTIARSNTTDTSLTSANLSNASSTYGVDTTGITNSAFQGTLQGFTATYTGTADTVNLSIQIGDYTYTAQNVDVTVASNTRVRLYSDTVNGGNGGYFDIQLAAGAVSAGFSNQAGADEVASRLNVAFTTLNFNQERQLNSYNGTQGISANGTIIGSLVGTSVSGQFADFDGLNLSDILVTAPTGSATDAKITLVINGVNYSTSAGLGTKLGANQTFRLVSEADANQYVEFTTGDTAIDISSAANATAVQEALKTAFGATEGSAALSFQIGSTSSDTLSVSIESATTTSLFSGESLDVLSQANASRAAVVIDAALAKVTSIRADVGALQSRFNFASSNIQIAVQNQDAAQSALLDTDIAAESTAYATAQVKLQAGISVLAQANQQLQALLKLIG